MTNEKASDNIPIKHTKQVGIIGKDKGDAEQNDRT